MSERNPSLGAFLRQERERRGMTLEQVASATKVSVRQLHALEADQYAEMPAKPFIRGFVTSYARFIGLDSQEILTQYDDFIDEKVKERPSRDSGHSGYAFEKKEGDQSRTLLWILIGALTLVSGIAFVIFKPKLGHHRSHQADRLKAAATTAPSPTPSPTPVPMASPITSGGAPSSAPARPPVAFPVPVASPTAAPIARPAPKVSPSPKPAPTSKPAPIPKPAPTPTGKPDPLNSGINLRASQIKLKALVKALEDVWVRYRVDSRPTMKIILRKNRILVLRAERDIHLQVSDPKAAVFNLNGQGYRTLASVKTLARESGTATLRVLGQGVETPLESFPGEAPLPTDVPASPRDAS